MAPCLFNRYIVVAMRKKAKHNYRLNTPKAVL